MNVRTFLLCSAIAAPMIIGGVPIVAPNTSASAQVVCCAPPPPVGGGASASASGAGGGQFLAYGVIGASTYLAVLNPQKGSDSILANTIHDEWSCALRPKKDPRPRCDVHNTLTLRQQLRLRRTAGLPPR